MGTSSSDFDFAEEIYLSEVLDGNEGGDLQQLDAKFAEQLQFCYNVPSGNPTARRGEKTS